MYYTSSYTPARPLNNQEYYQRPAYSPYSNFSSVSQSQYPTSTNVYQQRSYYPQQPANSSEIESIVNKYKNKQSSISQSNRIYSPPQKDQTQTIPEFKPQEYKAQRKPIFQENYQNQHQKSDLQLESFVVPQRNPYLSDDDSGKNENFQDLRSSELEFKEFSNQLPTPLAFKGDNLVRERHEEDHEINKFVDSVILPKVHNTMNFQRQGVREHVQKIDKIAENDQHVKMAILAICGFIFLYMLIEILK